MDGATIVMFIFQTVITVLIGAVGWGVKNALTELKAADKENADRIKEVERDLNDLKSDLPLVYATREDLIRITNNIDAKLDKLLYRSDTSGKE